MPYASMSGVITMPEFIDMLALPYLARAADHLVGWRNHHAVSNAQFRIDAAQWRQLLAGHSGRNFALFMHDTIAFSAALFGAWQAGKTVYLPSDTLPDTCKALAANVDGFIGDFAPEWKPLEAPSVNTESTTPTVADVTTLDADFIGLVVYTSGSTGTAQAIPKKLSQMSNEVATLDALFGARTNNAEIVSTVSHQHIYGLLFKVLWPICAGRAIHARSAFFPEDLAAIAPPRPWLLLSSPAHLKRFPNNPVTLHNTYLQGIFSSGGPLLAEVAQGTQQLFGHCPIEIYGSSETGGIAWREQLPDVQLADSWQPMPQVEVRRHTEHACLEVRSPHLPDHDWLCMADRVEFVDQQRFYLRGRADRIVKLEEKRISLDQIEGLLQASPLVAEVRVMVHAARAQRERIVVFLVPTSAGWTVLKEQGKLALNTQLRALLTDAIDSVALPRMWRYLEIMPANTQGKTTMAALAALLEEPGRAPPVLPEQTLVQRSETQVVLQLHVPEDLLYFQGHFPETPILPGIVQVNWAWELGRQYFDLPPHFLGMQALKFQCVILPGASVMMELEHDREKNALAFRLYFSGAQHASGRILLGSAA